MKNLFLFTFLLIVIITSCKKSDPQVTPNDGVIVGKWKDGPMVAIYYTAGKEVYRETVPAPTTLADYYEFTAANIFNIYSIQADKSFSVIGSANYTLLNANTTLRLTSASGSYDSGITFPDNNTLIITSSAVSTTSSPITYTQNNNVLSADSETDNSTLIRM